MTELKRCHWCLSDPLYIDYHDHEWGVPVKDDQTMFEFLILEGMQAGLSWFTILKKRQNFRQAFDHFNAEKIANYSDKKIAELMMNAGIIRNRLKIEAAIINAQKFLEIKKNMSFSDFMWQFVNDKPRINHWKTHAEVPASTKESDQMSKTLKKLGFKFVGSTICYAHMQATGMVNDHLTSCFRRK